MTGHRNHETDANTPGAGADPTIERAWHEASDELPPAALDAAILAAAHAAPTPAGDQRAVAAAASGRSARGFRQWQPFAIAASVAGLAFVLVQTLPREPHVATGESIQREVDVRESVPPDVGAQRPVPPAVATPGTAPAAGTAHESMQPGDAAADAVATMPERPYMLEESRSAKVAPTVAETPPPLEAAPGAAEASRVSAMESAAAPAPASTAKAATGGAVAVDAARAGAREAPRLAPGAWAERVATLHAAGDFDGAASSLRAFRASYERADDYLPRELRDWARSVE